MANDHRQSEIPKAVDAELSVLGGLMLDNRKWEDVEDILSEADFFVEAHRLVFRAIKALASAAKRFDWITVSEWMRDDREDDRQSNPHGTDSLTRAGGQGAIAQITMDVPGASNVGAYAEIVKERSIQRQLIATGLDIVSLGRQTDGRKSPDLVDEAERKLFGIRQKASQKETAKRSGDTIMQLVESLPARRNNDTARGLSTGFVDLDRRVRGLKPGQLIIVGGRPSMGKTSFAMNIADHVACLQGQPVAVFSMEMGIMELQERQLSSIGRVPLEHIQSGELEDDEYGALTYASELIHSAKIFIDDTAALTPLEIRSRARRIAAKHGLGLIVVDYIQLMQVPDAESQTHATGIISGSLKQLAKELNVPVIALSQLNRGLEARDNKRPRMADLRQSGAIEQDADVIVFMYRDDVYMEDGQVSPWAGTAEAIVAKQRGGSTGTERLVSSLHLARFDNMEPHVRREMEEMNRPKASGTRERKPGLGKSKANPDFPPMPHEVGE